MFDFSIFNKEQLQAIKHEKGPLLIVAGAGTGKTNVIAGRILYLLLEKKVKPENILALTFTEKASQEMEQRVYNELPIGAGEIYIKTFHSFCDAVLRERGLEIGLATDYTLLDETNQWMLIKKNLFKFNLDYYRPLGNPSKFISALLKHFSRLKDEDIKPEDYLEYALKSSKKKNKTEEENEKSQKTLEIASFYEMYQKLLLRENALDYGDLIMWTLRLLEKRKSVLAEYQNQFQHILVDEFQDTNFAQNKLLMLLAKKHKNIFVVGDDDQAIYKWRGASIANILSFEDNFKNAKKIVLSKNYRNTQNTLDITYKLIQKNNPNRLEMKLKIPKKLKANSDEKGVFEILHFNHFLEEVEFAVSKIEELLKQNHPDIAVLVRANSHIKPFIEELNRKGLPYQVLSEESLMTKPAIKDITSLLRLLADLNDNTALFRILSIPIFGIPTENLILALREAKKRHKSLYGIIKTTDPQNFSKIADLLADLIEFSRNKKASEVIGKFLKDSGYEESLKTEETAENIEKINSLAEFSKKIKEFEVQNKDASINSFVEYLNILEQAGESRGYKEEIDRSVPKLLTVHGAKGLEFDTVFIVNLVNGRFPSSQRKEAIEIPEELILEKLPEGNHHLEEERRLFYVAMTRAKQRLYLTYSDFYEGKKKWKPSCFILELRDSVKIETKDIPAMREKMPERIHRKIDKLQVNVKNLSFTQLDTFATCPLKYKFRYMLQIKTEPPAALNFGATLHNTLKDFYAYLKKSRSLADLDKKLIELYEKDWISYGYESRLHEEITKQKGILILKKYLTKNKDSLIIPAYLEQPFKIIIGGADFEGRIDRIDKLADNTYEIIDYKLGNSKKDLRQNLQLALYALACRDVLKLQVSKLSFYFLEENEKVSISPDEMRLTNAKNKIIELLKSFKESDFSASPGKHCGWCEYRTACDSAMIVR